MKNKKQIFDVHWYIPKRKTPIAGSTIATSELIKELAKTYKTVKGVYNALHNDYEGNRLFIRTNKYFDVEAELVLKKYIDSGYGDMKL